MREILSSIDIGSNTIKLVVGEYLNDRLNILCALDEESRGVERGVIVDPTETEYALKKLLKKAEEMLNVRISKAIVAINEDTCMFKIGEASITINSEDKEIQASDVVSVLQASVKANIQDGYDLITVVPIMFKVDDRKTRIPKGQRGSSLSVKSVIVSSLTKDICTVARVLEKCGVEVVDITIPSIGSYYAYHNETYDNSTGIIIDCGAETFKLAVVNKGIIINNLVINIGGINIDKDIGYIYKLSDKDAKKIKEKMGLANKRNASNKEIETITNLNGEKIEINQYELSEIITSRLYEMLNMAKMEINYLTKKEISYIIITGGLSEMRDFSLSVESVFGKIATLGNIQIVGVRDNKYASCIGMMNYFEKKLDIRDKDFSIFNADEEDMLCVKSNKKGLSGEGILSKVFGIFFDNN